MTFGNQVDRTSTESKNWPMRGRNPADDEPLAEASTQEREAFPF